jgi:pimeloyl-ACP methyl ester carboxylesterase
VRVVFVHGAFVRDGGWWWSLTAALLARKGIASDAVALPSCGENTAAPTASGPGLGDDAAALRAALDEGDDRTIVVAHSYGGMVAAQAGAHAALKRLVYISSFLPNPGDTLAALVPTADPVPVQPHADGSVSLRVDDRTAINKRFFDDVTDSTLIDGAYDRLTAQSSAVFGAAVTETAWQHIPSTYLVCADDRSTNPALQREHAARATDSIEIESGHHPFLSHPDIVAAKLVGIAGEL